MQVEFEKRQILIKADNEIESVYLESLFNPEDGEGPFRSSKAEISCSLDVEKKLVRFIHIFAAK